MITEYEKKIYYRGSELTWSNSPVWKNSSYIAVIWR